LPAVYGLVPPPEEVRTLAYLNGALATVGVLCPVLIPLLLFQIKHDFYARLIPLYGLEAALARNGQQVLRVMHEGVQRAEAGALTPPASVEQGEDVLDDLGKMLPWLPAYDRRDALVVWALLHMLSDEHAERESSTKLKRWSSMKMRRDTQSKLALAASCYTAALMEPSAGDPVGSLDVCKWLQQKQISLPMERDIRMSSLNHFGWLPFRGCPDVLMCPAGSLRVLTPPAVVPSGGCRWDASAMQPVAEVPAVVQTTTILCWVLSASVLFTVLFVTLLIDYLGPSSDAASGVVQHTQWGMSVAVPLYVLCSYCMLVASILLPLLYNYPNPVHPPSLTGSLGFHALKDLGAWLVFGYMIIFVVAAILWLTTSALSSSTGLLSSVELTSAAHPGGAEARVAYVSLLAMMHFWSLFPALIVGSTTWQLWHCGLRSGARYMLKSPDSKSATVVRFASPASSSSRELQLRLHSV
jgi:hypothetical protein